MTRSDDRRSDDPAVVLGASRHHDLELAAGDLDALWQRVSAETVAARPTLLARCREQSTPRRVGFVLLGTVAIAAIIMLVIGGVRGDLGTSELIVRYALALFGLTVLAGAVFAVALRGAHQRPLGWIGWALVAVGVAVPLLLSLVPTFWTESPPMEESIVDGCGFIGAVTGLFAAVLVWIFQRATTPAPVRVLASAAGGGVIAFAMLQLHCPANDVEHLIIGHSLVGVVLVVGAALIVGVRRMARR